MLSEILSRSSLVTGNRSETLIQGDEKMTTIRISDIITPEKNTLTTIHQNPLDDDEQQQQQQQQRRYHHLMPTSRTQKRIDASLQLFRCFVVQSSTKLPLKSIRTVPRLDDLKQTVVAGIPYLAFLALFALNASLRILPTADDVQRVTLYNVSQWEWYLLPCSVHKVIASMQHPFLDLLAALPYLAHYVLPLVYPVYLYLSNRLDLLPLFYKLLGWSMWVHYLIWLCLPTFPPWAVVHSTPAASEYFDSAPVLNLSEREGRAFSRVDQYIQWSLFHRLFSGNPVPFASFPSGHVAWPTCIFIILPPGGPVVFAFYITLVSWATMYSDHHYMLDVLAAILVVASTQKLINCITKPLPVSNEPIV